MTIKEKLETIKGKKIAIWCEKEWMANKLYNENNEGDYSCCWNNSDYCIDLEETDCFMHCDLKWYEEHGYDIVHFEDFIEGINSTNSLDVKLAQSDINTILDEKYGKGNWGDKVMEAKDAIMRIMDFGLHHAIEDLPKSTLTVEAFNKAIELLRLEESGRLVELPCRIGDILYLTDHECTEGMKYNCEIDGIMEGYLCRNCGTYPCTLHPSIQEVVVDNITIVGNNEIIIEFKDLREVKIDDFGKSVFLTREEAEEKLKGMV